MEAVIVAAVESERGGTDMITENEQALEAAYWAELEKRNEYASWVEAQVEAQEADEDEDGWDPRNDRW